ncbi:hypothetical protein AVEN_33576-1 [Araneus ventricosus]|uniref:Uncharacterized protein n=1 Tax=Araneus ventricosus TaxID=182803 RepID=A0A4Y2V197_ARAVE|nr:hypothetical protein AVEN_33576-1 [Araneus ventricosus]
MKLLLYKNILIKPPAVSCGVFRMSVLQTPTKSGRVLKKKEKGRGGISYRVYSATLCPNSVNTLSQVLDSNCSDNIFIRKTLRDISTTIEEIPEIALLSDEPTRITLRVITSVQIVAKLGTKFSLHKSKSIDLVTLCNIIAEHTLY